MISGGHIQHTQDSLLSEAFIRGRRAGLSGMSPALTQATPGSVEEQQWLEGWRSGNDERSFDDAQRYVDSPRAA